MPKQIAFTRKPQGIPRPAAADATATQAPAMRPMGGMIPGPLDPADPRDARMLALMRELDDLAFQRAQHSRTDARAALNDENDMGAVRAQIDALAGRPSRPGLPPGEFDWDGPPSWLRQASAQNLAPKRGLPLFFQDR